MAGKHQQLHKPLKPSEIAFGLDMKLPFIDDDGDDDHMLSELCNNRAQDIGDGKLKCDEGEPLPLNNEIDDYIAAVQNYYEKFTGNAFGEEREMLTRNMILTYIRFLQMKEGTVRQCSTVFLPLDINNAISEFISWRQVKQGEQFDENGKRTFRRWLLSWSMFLQARRGICPVPKIGVILTIMGLLLYVIDMVSDISIGIIYAYNGEWWKFAVTLLLVYAAIIACTIWIWTTENRNWPGRFREFCCISSLIVNWPGLQACWILLQLEWKLCHRPKSNAHLVLELHERRMSVALLKFTEGLWEACPQAILQSCLLLSELNGDVTWTVSIRITSTIISFCAAGAALVNKEKFCRIIDNIALPLRELFMLYMWTVPVTVSRLLSIALLLTMNLYIGLGCVGLHLILFSAYFCRTDGVSGIQNKIFYVCENTLQFLITPFLILDSLSFLLVLHVVHFSCNISVTVVWALRTSLISTHPTLYTMIIIFITAIFPVGLMTAILYHKHRFRELLLQSIVVEYS